MDKDNYIPITAFRGSYEFQNDNKTLEKYLTTMLLIGRQKTLKEFLILIGVPEDIAEKDSCKIEHSVSTVSLEALFAFGEMFFQIKVCIIF